MLKKIMLAIIVGGGGYYALLMTGTLDESTNRPSELTQMRVEVPAPHAQQVNNRAPVMEDRQALAVYANQLKRLYDTDYFRKIKMARSAELDAKIASSMKQVRDAGYSIGDGGSFVLNSNITQTRPGGLLDDSIKQIEDESESKKVAAAAETTDEKPQKSTEYYEVYSALSSMRLLMTDGERGSFDLGGQVFELAAGDSVGPFTISSIDFESGRAKIDAPEFGLSRTVIIGKRSYTRDKQEKPAPTTNEQLADSSSARPAPPTPQTTTNDELPIHPLGKFLIDGLKGSMSTN